MRLVSHFPRDASGKPALLIDYTKPDARELYNTILLVDEYMHSAKKQGKPESEQCITGYKDFDQLDKLLALAYWFRFCGLTDKTFCDRTTWEKWYLQKATASEHISRARRWLKEHRLAEFPSGVVENAKRQQKRYADGFSGKGWE